MKNTLLRTHAASIFRHLFAVLVAMYIAAGSLHAANILFTNTAGTPTWRLAANWNPNGAPGSADNAQFGAGAPGTNVSVNVGQAGGTQQVGSLEVLNTRTVGLTVQNVGSGAASAANGTIRFNGTTLNSVANTVLRNASTSILSFSNVTTLQIYLSFNTPASAIIDASGPISIASAITNAPYGFTKIGASSLTLLGTNTYAGPTIINAGTFQLSGNGSISNSPLISLTNGTTFDVSGLSNPFALQSGQTLSNNAASTGTLLGNILTTNGTLSISYTNGTPAFVETNGGLTLATNTVITIDNIGSQLTAGSYLIIATNTGGFVNGSVPSLVTVGDGGAAGTTSLSISNSQLYLVVSSGSTVSTNAFLTSITITPAGSLSPGFATNVLTFSATNAFGSSPTITVTNAHPTATNRLIYNGSSLGTLNSGTASAPLTLTLGVTNVLQVLVTAQDGVTTNLYTINLIEQPSLVAPVLTNNASATSLTLSWPADHLGYRLLVQTSNLDRGISSNPNDWATVAGSTTVTTTSLPIVKTNLNEYYRLVYP